MSKGAMFQADPARLSAKQRLVDFAVEQGPGAFLEHDDIEIVLGMYRHIHGNAYYAVVDEAKVMLERQHPMTWKNVRGGGYQILTKQSHIPEVSRIRGNRVASQCEKAQHSIAARFNDDNLTDHERRVLEASMETFENTKLSAKRKAERDAILDRQQDRNPPRP